MAASAPTPQKKPPAEDHQQRKCEKIWTLLATCRQRGAMVLGLALSPEMKEEGTEDTVDGEKFWSILGA